MEYNSSRNHLNMREYGRHIQIMVLHICNIEDADKRNQQANMLIELMAFLNPQLKVMDDYKQKLWDDLFYISDFALVANSPYPIPQKESLNEKPTQLPYPKRKPRYNHLGKNLELVIDKALAEEDEEKKLGFSNSIAYYMKLSYNNWHKENIHDENIRAELTAITNGQLDFTQTGYVKFYRANEGRSNNNNNRNNRNFRNNNANSGTASRNNNNPKGNSSNRPNNNSSRNNNFKKKRF